MIRIGQSERRREARSAVAIEAGLRPRHGCRAAVLVTNLSRHGCAVHPIGAARVGDTVWLRLPGLESWEAVVAWREDARGGLSFVRPLHASVAQRLGRG